MGHPEVEAFLSTPEGFFCHDSIQTMLNPLFNVGPSVVLLKFTQSRIEILPKLIGAKIETQKT